MALSPPLSRLAGQALLCAALLAPYFAEAEVIAHWKFDEQTTGNVLADSIAGGSVVDTVLDSSGQGNHMQTWTTATAPSYTTSVAFPRGSLAGTPATGALNSAALNFPGSPVDLYTNSKPINGKAFEAWTVEASFRLDAVGRWQVIVGKDGNPVHGQSPLSLKVRADNRLEIGMVDGSGMARWCVGDTSIVAHTWYRVAATASSTDLSLWIKPEDCRDYIPQGSVPIQGAFFNTYPAFNQPWIIGRGMWNGVMTDAADGLIDDVRISDSALSPDKFLGNFSSTDSDSDGLPDTWELVHFRADASELEADILAKQSSLAADPDGDGYSNRVELRSGTNPAVADDLTGKLTRQVWLRVPGEAVSDLSKDSRFYTKADITTFTEGISLPRDFADNFGERLQGWLIAPTTGDYTFWIAGDNQCELWLSTSQSKFLKRLLASVPDWTAPDEWEKFPAQKSTVVHLVAGQKYFFECLHKEGAYSDNLSVAWQAPGEARQIIPPQQLEPYLEDTEDNDLDGLNDAWEQTVGLSTDFMTGADVDNGAAGDPDEDGFYNFLEAQTGGNPYGVGGNLGYVQRDVWTGVLGFSLKDLVSHPSFYGVPDRVTIEAGGLSFGDLLINDYGQRIQGLLVPPRTGNWRFWIASDDASELRLSASSSLTDKRRVAHLDTWTNDGHYDVFASQRSENIFLTAGQSYAFEILHKDGTLWDHLRVAWAYQPENWALASMGATATQSSTYGNCPAERAIDGNTDGSSFTHTNGVAGSWWEVNFGQGRSLNRVVLTNRKDVQYRLSNFRISVRDAQDQEIAGQNFFEGSGHVGNSLIWDLPTRVTASKIRIALLGDNNGGDGCLTLAEVQAFDWVPEAERQVVDSAYLRTLFSDVRDADADSLPDSWENEVGLDPADNGAVQITNGEYGDADGDLLSNREEYLLGSAPSHPTSAPGRLLVERWNNIPAYRLSELVATKRIYGAPDQTELKAPQDLMFPGIYFGTRSRGYFHPKQTGDYTFWLSSGSAELLFSADQATGKYGKRRIAILDPSIGTSGGVAPWDGNRWDQFASQRSATLRLESGKAYYFEVLNQHGHPANTHVSLAWAMSGHVRESFSGEMVSSYVKTADDHDDDYLPDYWEQQYGLDLNDNGLGDAARQGERGDFDHDGLSNRDEFLQGTHPADSDTDNDGVNDSQEVALGTNPVETDAPTEVLKGTIDLGQYISQDTEWMSVDGGLVSKLFRGAVEWPFDVTEPGFYSIQINNRLRGNWVAGESVPIDVSVDGQFLARKVVHFDTAGRGFFHFQTQRLSVGSHRLRLFIDNVIARRSVQIDAIQILKPWGADEDSNGNPDWLDLRLAQQNRLVSPVTSSRTSPAFLEGDARFPEAVTVQAGGATLTPQTGIHATHWYANVPLESTGPVQCRIEFGEGLPFEGAVGWEATNVLSGETIRIRKGDKLLLSAFDGDPAGSAVLTVAGASYSLSGNQTFISQFSDAGLFEVLAVHSSGMTATLKVEVMQAQFAANRDLVCNESELWQLPASSVSSGLFFEGGDGLDISLDAVNQSGTGLWLYPRESGELSIAARLWSGGPIVAKGTVNSVLLSDTLQNNVTLSDLSTSIPGYAVYYSYLVSSGLPPGGKIVVTIYRGGVTFLDGTTVKEFTAEDFVNGVARVEMLAPAGMDGGACHYISIVDRNGVIIGYR